MGARFSALDLTAQALSAEELEMLHQLAFGWHPKRRSYGIITIAQRHPKLFSALAKAFSIKQRIVKS